MKWNHVTELEVVGGRLMIKDAMTLLDGDRDAPEWPTVAVAAGTYAVEIHVPQRFHCTRVRVVRAGSSPTSGKQVGEVSVDHAKVGILDYDAFFEKAYADFDAYEEWTGTELDDELGINFSGLIEFEGSPLAYVSSGDGDGVYPVFELVDDDEVVGLECRFDEPV